MMSLKYNVQDDNMCFACGKNNEISLGLEFDFVEDNNEVVKAQFIPESVHQGYKGIMHGGLISTLLDEAMVKVAHMNGIEAVTAEINVRYKKPVKIGTDLEIKGILITNRGKLILTESELKDQSGQIYARAEAKLMKIE